MKQLFLLLTIGMAAACTKHAGDVILPSPTANITVFKPTAGGVYHTGDSVRVSALAIAPAAIHGYDIAVKKGNDTTTYFFMHVHDHNDTIVVDQQWKNVLSAPLKLEVELTFYLDHNGYTAVKRVPFSIE